MPELPEVETVMRGLQARLEGRVLLRAVAHRPDLRWPLPTGLGERLTGARVAGFRRRGKYILMRLDSGWSVLLHLGMSGRMVIGPAMGSGGVNSITLHEHLELETDDGWRVGFVDPRRFGSVDLVETAHEDAHRLLAGLGPEPLDDGFSVAVLDAALTGKRTPIKAALLDQKIVAGLGNIYCQRGAVPRRHLTTTPASSVPGARAPGWCRRSRRRCGMRSRPADLRCVTTFSRTGNWDISSMPGVSMDTRVSPAPPVPVSRFATACAGWCSRAAARSIARGCSARLQGRLGCVRMDRCVKLINDTCRNFTPYPGSSNRARDRIVRPHVAP